MKNMSPQTKTKKQIIEISTPKCFKPDVILKSNIFTFDFKFCFWNWVLKSKRDLDLSCSKPAQLHLRLMHTSYVRGSVWFSLVIELQWPITRCFSLFCFSFFLFLTRTINAQLMILLFLLVSEINSLLFIKNSNHIKVFVLFICSLEVPKYFSLSQVH